MATNKAKDSSKKLRKPSAANAAVLANLFPAHALIGLKWKFDPRETFTFT